MIKFIGYSLLSFILLSATTVYGFSISLINNTFDSSPSYNLKVKSVAQDRIGIGATPGQEFIGKNPDNNISVSTPSSGFGVIQFAFNGHSGYCSVEIYVKLGMVSNIRANGLEGMTCNVKNFDGNVGTIQFNAN